MKPTIVWISKIMCFFSLAPLLNGFKSQSRFEIASVTDYSEHQIRIGVSVSAAAGDEFEVFGRNLFGGYTLFANWVNIERKGVVINGTNYTIAVDFIEDYSNSDYVAAAYDKLDPVCNVYFGPYSSGLTKTAATITESRGDLMLAGAAADPAIFATSSSTFGTLPPSSAYLEVAFSTFSSLGAKKLGILFDSDYVTCDNITLTGELSKEYELPLYAHIGLNKSSPTYSNIVESYLREFMQNGVDVIHGCTYYDLCVEIVTTMKKLNYNASGIMITSCFETPSFLEAVGEDAMYVMMPTPWVKYLDIIDEYTGWSPMDFDQQFLNSYGVHPTYHAASAFAGGTIIMAAAEKTQSLEPSVLAGAIRTMNFQTVYRNITFTKSNQADLNFLVVQMQSDLTYKLVLPEPQPNITITYPMPSWLSKDCISATTNCAGHGYCNNIGHCVCDPFYFGYSDVNSCDTFCHGEIAFDEVANEFCKNITWLDIGALVLATDINQADYEEFKAMIQLGVEMVNNKTDGWFDGMADQIMISIEMTSGECNEQGGYDAAQYLDEKLYSKTNFNYTKKRTYGVLDGIIGAYCSSSSIGASEYSNVATIPMISYSSTSPTLSSKYSYAYFARVAPSDNIEARLLSSLLLSQNLTIAMILSTDGSYEQAYSDALTDRYEADGGEILEVIQYSSSDATSTSYYDYLITLVTTVGSPVIILIVYSDEAVKIFDAVNRSSFFKPEDYLWVGVGNWIGVVNNSPVGSIGPIPRNVPDNTSSVGQRFMKYWKELDPIRYPDADGDRNSTAQFSTFCVDAVVSMAVAQQQLINNNFNGSEHDRRQKVFNEILNSVQFNGVTGLVDFDENGDPINAAFDVLNNIDGNGTWITVGFTLSNKYSEDLVYIDKSIIVWPDGSVGTSSHSYNTQYVPICPAGYEPIDSVSGYSCYLCPVGKYKAYAGSELCSECPEGTDCNDVGIQIPCVLPSYWRGNAPENELGDFDKWKVYDCDTPDRCLGGCDLTATCGYNTVHTSPVCDQCLDGYYSSDRVSCSKCPDNIQTLNILNIVFTLTSIILFITFYLFLIAKYISLRCNIDMRALSYFDSDSRRSVSRNSEQKNARSSTFENIRSTGIFVTVKLTISFVQIIVGSLGSINIRWSYTLSKIFRYFTTDPTALTPIFTDCLGNDGVLNKYADILLYLFIPIGFLVLAYLTRELYFFAIKRSLVLRELKIQDAARNALNDIILKSIVWFFLFSFPFLIKANLTYFNCRDMGVVGVYNRGNYSIDCETDQYKFYSVIAAINLALWLCGIPAFFYYLIRHRDESWAAIGSLPLHANFTPDLAYYEVFELLRKTLLIAVVQFVFPNTSTQCIYLLAVDMSALLVLSISRPYLADPDDFLSGVLILIECILFFVAFLIMSNVHSSENFSESSLMDFSVSLIILALFVFVPFNIAQKLTWIRQYFSEWHELFNEILSKTGLKYFVVQGFSARSRYVAETEELLETVQVLRSSMVDYGLPLETKRETYGMNIGNNELGDRTRRPQSFVYQRSAVEVRSGLMNDMDKSDSTTIVRRRSDFASIRSTKPPMNDKDLQDDNKL